jgi:hypothetical protein
MNMQDRNQAGTGKHTAGPGRNPNPAAPRDPAAGDPARTRGPGAAPGAPRPRDERDPVDRDLRGGAHTTPGARGAPYDPKNAGATGTHGDVRAGRTTGKAPGPGSDFVKGSGTWRSMKSWQPWVLIGAAVLLVIIGLWVL